MAPLPRQSRCPTCNGTREQQDDRNCDCFIPALEGAGQHSPGCACFKPCPDCPEGGGDAR